MLSFIYRLLTLAHKRDEVTLDMMGTFEEARVEARSRGSWSYFLFAAREISGLLSSPSRMIRKSGWTLIAGGGLAGLALGVGASYFWPAAYTSEVQLQIVRPQIPRNLLASGDALDLDSFLDSFVSQARFAISRDIEREKEFYPHLRAEKKAEALREEINKALRIERSGDLVRVVFTYRDYPPAPDDAVKATQLATRCANILIEENMRVQAIQVEGTVEFFRRQAEYAAASWEQLNKEIRSLATADPRFDRLALDRELARKEYESMRQKLSEAEALGDQALRQKGWRLQVNEPANTPEGPDVSRLQMALSGLGGGLLVGFIAWLWAAMRDVPSVLLTVETAPID